MIGFKFLGSKTKSNDSYEYSIWQNKHSGSYCLYRGKTLNTKLFNSNPTVLLLESYDYTLIQKALDEI